MVIITTSTLHDFARKHPSAIGPINDWIEKTQAADWKHLSDIKKTFNSVDYVGEDRYVFNIKGNDFRLIAMIFFPIRTLYIRFIGTHAEYDDVEASTA